MNDCFDRSFILYNIFKQLSLIYKTKLNHKGL